MERKMAAGRNTSIARAAAFFAALLVLPASAGAQGVTVTSGVLLITTARISANSDRPSQM